MKQIRIGTVFTRNLVTDVKDCIPDEIKFHQLKSITSFCNAPNDIDNSLYPHRGISRTLYVPYKTNRDLPLSWK